MSAVEVREILPPDTGLAFEAMRALREQLAGEGAFVRQVDEVMRPHGYRLAGAFEPGEERATAVAGFRLGHSFAWGAYLYVDDLATLEPFRRRGHAGALLDWLLVEARDCGCGQVHLDSGVERVAAHRLYAAHGFAMRNHHFERPVSYAASRSPHLP